MIFSYGAVSGSSITPWFFSNTTHSRDMLYTVFFENLLNIVSKETPSMNTGTNCMEKNRVFCTFVKRWCCWVVLSTFLVYFSFTSYLSLCCGFRWKIVPFFFKKKKKAVSGNYKLRLCFLVQLQVYSILY